MFKSQKSFIGFTIASLLLALNLIAQPAPDETEENLPKDYLNKDFHTGRRDALRQIMPDNSVMVVFAYPTRTFSNDVEYLYHANPDMYYFSGYKEPHSLLLIFKEEQQDSLGNSYNEILFIQKRNPKAEQWTGRRLGIDGAKTRSGIKTVYNASDFKSFAIDFSKYSKIIMDRFPDGLTDGYDNADLFDLIEQLKEKIY